MHNPPHPGEFITDIFLELHGISGRELAVKLDVAHSPVESLQRWRFDCLKPLADRLKAGWPCRMPTIYGLFRYLGRDKLTMNDEHLTS